MVNIKKINKVEIGKSLLPEKILKLKFKEELESVYERINYDKLNYLVITNLFFLSIIITFVVMIVAFPYLESALFIGDYLKGGFFWSYTTTLAIWFVMNLLIYYSALFYYFFKQDSKLKKTEAEIEDDLPEFIDNLVSNLKGGVSLEKGLLQSVRKEQKELLKEITLINEKIMMGRSVQEALKEFRLRFNSAIINRTFFLIEEGIKGGGNLAAPLERISENLKRIYNLDEEIKSSASGFTVIISFITILIAPLLFGLAITLLGFIGNLFGLLAGSNTSFFSLVAIPEEFTTYLRVFSYAMIILITFFSSLIIAQLKNEKTYTAIKYLPIYIFISVMLYNIFSEALIGFFGTLAG